MMKRWRRRAVTDAIPIYTCARPGRGRFGPQAQVPDSEVIRWLSELPKHRPLSIISLLGHKPDGMDEHAFYSFRDASGFQKWLGRQLEGTVNLFSHPTTDFGRVDSVTVMAIRSNLDQELSLGRTVVIVDSGGVQRTGQICREFGLIEDTRTLPQEP